ncbi:hypothetical protein ACFQY0_20885 [Haloferula chungangensis]|uniref:RDD domain-containing protein n=1 Tax=Haloferula chungangensis TaxID=1048331 RepID=A0ABW2LD77_9BACT
MKFSNPTTELIGVGMHALLAVSLSWVDLLVISLGALGVLACVVTYLDAHDSQKMLIVRFKPVEGSCGLSTVRAFVSWLLGWYRIGNLILEVGILRLKFSVLALENRYLLTKQRKMLGLDRGRPMFFDKLLYKCQWVHEEDSSANVKSAPTGAVEGRKL